MNEETIVAVFDTAEHAAAAVRDLESAGVPSSAISQHAGGATGSSGSLTNSTSTTTQPGQEKGFWASLFGAEPEYGHDTTVYDRSLQGGSTVVTVRGSEQHLTQVMDILERHNPIDIDERAASYGASSASTSGLSTASTTGLSSASATGLGTASATGLDTASTTGTSARATTEPGTIQLSEETLAIGKRAVNRGTTRVRRYVVETPVEETVNLHSETVTIERRPVTDGRAVGGTDFTDKVIEVTETAEEAVVGKQARVREEVVIHKEGADRTETVRDTVRREDVEITKEPATTTTGTTTGTMTGSSSFGGTKGTSSTTGTVASAPYKPTV